MEEDLSTLTESRLSYLTLWPYHQGGISKVTVAQLDQIIFDVAKSFINLYINNNIREMKKQASNQHLLPEVDKCVVN